MIESDSIKIRHLFSSIVEISILLFFSIAAIPGFGAVLMQGKYLNLSSPIMVSVMVWIILMLISLLARIRDILIEEPQSRAAPKAR